MMDKSATVSMLKLHGYNAELVDGVVMVFAKDDCYKKISKLLLEVGYTASWGVKKAESVDVLS